MITDWKCCCFLHTYAVPIPGNIFAVTQGAAPDLRLYFQGRLSNSFIWYVQLDANKDYNGCLHAGTFCTAHMHLI